MDIYKMYIVTAVLYLLLRLKKLTKLLIGGLLVPLLQALCSIIA